MRVGALVAVACAGIASGSVIVPRINAHFGPGEGIPVSNLFVSAPTTGGGSPALSPSETEVTFSPASGPVDGGAVGAASPPGDDTWATGPEEVAAPSAPPSLGCPVETDEKSAPGAAAAGGLRAGALRGGTPKEGES